MRAPAAPYAELAAVVPRYQPIKDLPRVKRIAVINPPIPTSRHAIGVSGNTLKIAANKMVKSSSDMMVFKMESIIGAIAEPI